MPQNRMQSKGFEVICLGVMRVLMAQHNRVGECQHNSVEAHEKPRYSNQFRVLKTLFSRTNAGNRSFTPNRTRV